MTKLYRIIAIILILLGLLTIAQVVRSTWNDITHTQHSQPLHCSNGICRTIQPDGTLADDTIVKEVQHR